MKGNLIIISAPSGTGKTTILRELFTVVQGLTFSVSHTTRQPRGREKNSVDYHFIDRQTFEKMIANEEFLEWAEVHGNFYGTSRKEVEGHLQRGFDVFLDIDVQGARQVRQKMAEKCFSIFIISPTWQEQEKRLTGRGTDSPETIRLRLANARQELNDVDLYDFLVVNDTVAKATDILRSIVIAERSRKRRDRDGNAITMPKETP